ncbi:hypothetical protein B0H15DRAFT_810434 [Mycena belliarum]|uniref:Uncharacterized protein n=1 Tax=Mycena belliarum TaxID=1033014 RepID=A0AAD6UJ98_9AGAR|nr:hypothetical protein B0H15DRAFT_810434 [Mycena belliae]
MFKTTITLDAFSFIGLGMSLVAAKNPTPALIFCSVSLLVCASGISCVHQWVRSPVKDGRLHKELVPEPLPPPQAPPPADDENGNDGGDGDGDPDDLDVDAADDREGDGQVAVGAAPAPEDPPPPAGGVEEGDYEGELTKTRAIAVLVLFLIRLVVEFQKRQRGANALNTVKTDDSLPPAVPTGRSAPPSLGLRRFWRKLYLQLTLYPGLALIGGLSLLLLPAAQEHQQQQEVLQARPPDLIEDERPRRRPPPVDIPEADAPPPAPDPDAAQPTRL